ncbi:MAG: YdeI/OmpD-associated family protein [Chloroflexota bacterium]
MAKTNQEPETFYAKDREEWRAWLLQNHNTSAGIRLIYYKKGSGKPRVAYEEAVEEALCFGWIDSVTNVIDDERYMQLFSPRKPKSPWSKVNKVRIEKMVAQGLMTDAGLQKIESAKADGSWSSYDGVDDLQVPDDLAQALAANETANQYFHAFSNSSKKIILWWITSAKRPETRQKRITETVKLAEQNIKANHPRP